MDPATEKAIKKYALDILLIVVGISPFIPQYYVINKTRNDSGFSVYVCGIIVFVKSFKVIYWSTGVPINWVGVIDGVSMILMMFLLLELCVRIYREKIIASGQPLEEHKFQKLEITWFWYWTDFFSYITATFTILSFVVSIYAWWPSELIRKCIWGTAAILDCFTFIPLLVVNAEQSSTLGQSFYMVLFSVINDALKLLVAYIKHSSLSTTLVGAIVDGILIAQVLYYRERGTPAAAAEPLSATTAKGKRDSTEQPAETNRTGSQDEGAKKAKEDETRKKSSNANAASVPVKDEKQE